jgi:hypothetical protein
LRTATRTVGLDFAPFFDLMSRNGIPDSEWESYRQNALHRARAFLAPRRSELMRAAAALAAQGEMDETSLRCFLSANPEPD